MGTMERLIQTWMASGKDEEIRATVLEITSGDSTLLNVVKALGEYLTSEEDELRTKGVEFLSLILERCPAEKISRQSAKVLISFYCEKLDDTETIIPALKGLVTLTLLPTCTTNDAISVVHAIFRHVNMRVLVQSVRFLVFSIIDALLAHHREALKGLGKEFLGSYILLAEGEKDPRNLLVAFAIARVLLIEFDISNHVESLFNITFCYFPITFRPPPNDPYGITTDDLRLALRGCLCATSNFGPMAIPVFLEKLTAGSPTTKRDTLQAMAACLPVYGSSLARVSARKLWNIIKLEIFQPIDTLTEGEALKTTQVLVKTIYSDQERGLEIEEDIQGFVRDTCDECIRVLQEPEKSQAKPAMKILCAFMGTTPSIARYTATQVVPHLVKLFSNPDEASNRPPILLLITDFIVAARDSVTGEIQDVKDAVAVPLQPYKDEVLGVVSVGLKSSSSRLPALAGLKAMVTTKSLLTDEELAFVVHNVSEVLHTYQDGSDDTSDAILNLLTTISANAPWHIEQQTLPLLFSSLPDTAPSREASKEREQCWGVLSALRVLSIQPELFNTFISRLMAKLLILCIPEKNIGILDTDTDTEPRAAYAHSLLKTIAHALSGKVEQGHQDIEQHIDQLLPQLFNLFIFSALQSDSLTMIATNDRLVSAAGEIITLVTQSSAFSKQEILAEALFHALLTGDVTKIAQGSQKLPVGVSLLPLDRSAPTAQKNLITLFAAAIVALHKEVRISVPTLEEFLSQVLEWGIIGANNNLQRESAWHIVSSVVNKRTDDVLKFLENTRNQYLFQRIRESNAPLEMRRQAIKSWTWISKALLIKSHPLSLRFTDSLFEVFDDESINWDAAKAIGELGGVDTVLTKRNHAIIKILHSQKFVNSVLPRIIIGAKDPTKPLEQTAYLVALTSLIKAIPKAAYVHEMTSLIPLFLRGLELPDANIRLDVIDTLLAAAEGDTPEQSLVSEHASTLVTSMLKNSMIEEMPTMRVRIAALRYLGNLPSIVRYDVLHPYKSTVIRQLAKVLDDPKRSVRMEAVDARTSWFKYNG